jgi:hypothetical protein
MGRGSTTSPITRRSLLCGGLGERHSNGQAPGTLHPMPWKDACPPGQRKPLRSGHLAGRFNAGTHARTTRPSAAVPYHRVLREVVVRILSVYPEHGDGAVGMDALACKRHHGKSTGLHAPGGRLSPSAPGSPRPAAPRAPSASRSNRRWRGIGRRLAAEADRKGGPRRPFLRRGWGILCFPSSTPQITPPLPN